MKKIVICRTSLLAPSETFIKQQILSLTEWTPVLVGYRHIPNGLDLAGIDVRILPGLSSGNLQRWWLRLCGWLGIAHAPTVRALRETGASLVHIHFGTDAVDFWPSVRKLGLPVLVTLHGYDINIHRDWWEAGHQGMSRRIYPRRLLRIAKDPAVHFIAVSRAIMNRAIAYGIPANKIAVSYIGVDTNYFKPRGPSINQRTKRILFIGRMVEKKAPLFMIRTFATIRESIPDAELSMLGDGPLLNEAKTLSAQLALPVKFLGSCTSDEVIVQLTEARVLCLPSVTAANGDAEGFGIVILEAQACGVPVVSSANGGAKEGLLHGKTGYAFDEYSAQQVTEALLIILKNDKAALIASRAARRFTTAFFDIKNCTKALEGIYCATANTSNRT